MAVRRLGSSLGRCRLNFERSSLLMFASSLASPFKDVDESSLKSVNTTPSPNLKNQILRLKLPGESAISVLQSWSDNGYKVTFDQLRYISAILMKSKRYKPALEIFTWMETRNNSRISAADKAMRLELIIKVHGIREAEDYFKLMADSASRKEAFLSLLRGYVKERDTVKAEGLMMNLNDSGLLVSPHPFNEMMKLYMSTSQHEKVPFVILQMKRNKIPLNVLSYNLWMNSCCEMSEVTKVEMVYKEMMNDKNVEVGWSTLCTLGNAYTKAGMVEKALWALTMAEKKLSTNSRLGYFFLITQYCSLRNKEGVQRLWESSKGVGGRITCANYICILSCFVKVNNLVEAERAFMDWESNCRNYDTRVSNVLLGAYVRKGLINRAESLHVRTLERGGRPNFKTWEILLEGWVKSQKMDKAITAMNRAFCLLMRCDWRPSPGNLIAIAEHLEKKGSFEEANRYIRVVHHFGLASLRLYKIFLRMHLSAGKTAFDILEMMGKDKIGMDDETFALVEALKSYA
ncbi:pentatricopeptide repeat-containing protein At5g27460 [Euphorbia lathyris]|uniref:pentatricopeptide repeat-containing protein At5g27460 n=1 Tax=Euphorbia lathyris TaxID=212925 RepID=UPI0033137312